MKTIKLNDIHSCIGHWWTSLDKDLDVPLPTIHGGSVGKNIMHETALTFTLMKYIYVLWNKTGQTLEYITFCIPKVT